MSTDEEKLQKIRDRWIANELAESYETDDIISEADEIVSNLGTSLQTAIGKRQSRRSWTELRQLMKFAEGYIDYNLIDWVNGNWKTRELGGWIPGEDIDVRDTVPFTFETDGVVSGVLTFNATGEVGTYTEGASPAGTILFLLTVKPGFQVRFLQMRITPSDYTAAVNLTVDVRDSNANVFILTAWASALDTASIEYLNYVTTTTLTAEAKLLTENGIGPGQVISFAIDNDLQTQNETLLFQFIYEYKAVST